MISKTPHFIIFAFLLWMLFSASVQSQNTVLEDYIKTGLENNLRLKMKNDSLRMSIESMKQAKGMFFPEITLNARYTIAEGGRMIDFPVGDLLNPVYSTLNSLTGSDQFAPVENQAFPFLRPHEHETKLRLVQPLFKSDLYYNKQIKETFTGIRETDLEEYKNELIKEIRLAYYNYMMALETEKSLKESEEVVQENLRVNRSLLENEMITREAVLQAEAELASLRQAIADIKKMKNSAAAWFNFLLNRELNDEITAEDPSEIISPPALETARKQAVSEREELKKLGYYREVAEKNLELNKSSRLPDLFAVIDYGYQGEDYSFTKDDDFLIASLVLSWDIFHGLEKQREIDKSEIQFENIETRRAEAEKLIELEVINAWYDLEASSGKIEAARQRAKASREAFRMIDRKYSEGLSSMLEFTAARREMTGAEINLVRTRYEYLSKYAAFERAAGLTDINKYK